jgi:hypothetical protein
VRNVPTHEESVRFLADFHNLTPVQQAAFIRAARLFRAGLTAGAFHPRFG